jgi:hypothetical protein
LVARRIAGTLVALALLLAAVHWLDRRAAHVSRVTRPVESDRLAPSDLHFGGLSYVTAAGESQVQMQIGDLDLRDLKAGFFTLSAVKELELRDLAIRLSPCREPVCSEQAAGTDTESYRSIDDALRQPIQDLNLGLVARVNARRVEISWSDGDAVTLTLKAGRMGYGLGTEGVRLGESIAATSREGASLQAGAASWDTKRALLDVRGDFEWSDGRAPAQKGRRGSFSIDPQTGIRRVADTTLRTGRAE